MKRRMHPVVLFASVSLLSGVAAAQPVEWTVGEGGNGHTYELVTDLVTWPEAQTAAIARGGFLATIVNQAEQDFIQNHVLVENDDLHHAWIGGYQDLNAPDYAEPAGGWRWLTGEEWSYTNWFGSEPSNTGGDEHFLMAYQSAANFGFWNDDDDSRVAQYVVEYNAPVPAASTWAAIVTALLVLTIGTLAVARVRSVPT